MIDWTVYVKEAKTDDDVAMIPFFIFELARKYQDRTIKRLAWCLGLVTVALIVVLVWR